MNCTELLGCGKCASRSSEHVSSKILVGIFDVMGQGQYFRKICISTWKTILPFFLVKTHFSFFLVDYGFLPNTVFFQHTGTFFFSTTCWKNTGLLRVSASTRIKYEPKYAYGHFFWTLRGLPIIDQKKCQYGFSGTYINYIYMLRIYLYTYSNTPHWKAHVFVIAIRLSSGTTRSTTATNTTSWLSKKPSKLAGRCRM